MGTSGNFSAVASARPLKLLMTPSGAHKGRLKPSDLLIVDAQGRVKAGTRKPSAETLLHLEIIRARGPHVENSAEEDQVCMFTKLHVTTRSRCAPRRTRLAGW
jgi:hypothetical protein